MPGFSRRGFDPAGFEPAELDWPEARGYLATVFRATPSLSGWEVYAEPPEQLAGGRSIVIGPRSPYRSWDTYGAGTTHIVVFVLVPRSSAPAMDAIDAGLAGVREALMALDDVGIGNVTTVGTLDDVGGAAYLVASLDVDHE